MSGRTEDEQRAPNGDNIYNTWDSSRHDSSRHQVGDNHYNIHHYHGQSGKLGSPRHPQDRLEEYVSKGAAHDSAERGTDAPKCFPETREVVQGELLGHIEHGKARVVWLTGPAGAGKTAIMGSIADECHARRWLAGSFFISVAAMKVDRCSKRYIIPTLAYHLLQLNIPGLRAAILASIDAHPSVFDKRLDQQVEILILAPIRGVLKTANVSGWPKAILVDGVDECDADEGRTFETEQDRQRSKEDNHREVLSALVQANSDPSFPFHIIIASRPEQVIKGYFSSLPQGAIKKMFLDSKYSPEADMELYARAMLNQIGMTYGLPEGWYVHAGEVLGIEDVPRYWAQEASGQFVYVATVMRYVQIGPGTPYECLERVLNWRRGDPSKPFSALDALYDGILKTSPDPILAVKWIRAVLWYTSHEVNAWYITTLQESSPGEVGYLLGPLSSLIRIVKEDGQPDFHFYHKSLSDFLKDSQRSGDLYLTGDEVYSFEASRYSAVLKIDWEADKGPLVPLPANRTFDAFMAEFCLYLTLPYWFPPAHNFHHDASDVDWWLAHHHLARDAPLGAIEAFCLVHNNCRWYACRPSCKLWRKCILRFAKANSWRVPTVLETLQDRFKHVPSYSGDPREVYMNELLGPLDWVSQNREDRLWRLERGI
ncbi:hypothetical protein FA13DRAFT_1704278 [Coprinellus micaceus]|uniref:Nephrocystin 3-like N-terminal domain-containing protein n=1 Tax=Coprinellus micaceus TaxID=71717 RepID=A0A4Y7U1C6_COPMI|nr:hypothetical protein FA13DRAFT_1704278 [Coprinellus micaceus]